MLKLIGGSSGEKHSALEQPTTHWKAGTQTTVDGPPGSRNATTNFEVRDAANAVLLEVGKAKRESSGGFIATLGHDVVESVALYKSTLNECTAPSEGTHKQASPTKYSGLLSGQGGPSTSQYGDYFSKAKLPRQRKPSSAHPGGLSQKQI